ncbi:MAG: general secretion pathway protein GspK [Thermodesulfobacteriota bacterium]
MKKEMKALDLPSILLDSRGVALIMVLWVIAILSVIVLEFCFGMRTEVNMTKNFREETTLYALAEGGIQRTIAELIYKHDPLIQQKRKAMEGNLPSEKEVWVTDGRPIPLSFSQGKCEIKIMGEDGKININMVSEAFLRKIVKNMGLEGEAQDVVVDSIMDWKDPDDLHRLNGAENDYYQSLPEPYFCKNGYLDSIEELLLIRGVTQELFYGKKRKEEGKSEKIGLKDIFSIYAPGEQININHASPLVMRVALGIPPGVAELIVKGREEKAFENPQDLIRRIPEVSPFLGEIGRNMIYQSRTTYYTIESRATGLDSSSVRGIKAIVKIDRQVKQGYKVIQWMDAL